jgi:hypothetical protein
VPWRSRSGVSQHLVCEQRLECCVRVRRSCGEVGLRCLLCPGHGCGVGLCCRDRVAHSERTSCQDTRVAHSERTSCQDTRVRGSANSGLVRAGHNAASCDDGRRSLERAASGGGVSVWSRCPAALPESVLGVMPSGSVSGLSWRAVPEVCLGRGLCHMLSDAIVPFWDDCGGQLCLWG